MGSIPEAIGESRRKGLVFIVFVEGKFLKLIVQRYLNEPFSV